MRIRKKILRENPGIQSEIQQIGPETKEFGEAEGNCRIRKQLKFYLSGPWSEEKFESCLQSLRKFPQKETANNWILGDN